MPNTWEVGGEVVRAPARLQKAMRSRPMGSAPEGRTGTSAPPHLQRRYYSGYLLLARTLRRLDRAGANVRDDLFAMGSVYVRTHNGRYQQVTATEALKLLGKPPPDISPHHLREDQSVRGARREPDDGLAGATKR